MFWKAKKVEDAGPFEIEEVKTDIQKTHSQVDPRVLSAPKWIEVEGYKAVHYDMSSFQGRETYQIGETKTCNSPISPCRVGYHFGKDLKEVVMHYPPVDGARYFKVKGLVPTLSYIGKNDELFIVPKTCGRMLWEKDLINFIKKVPKTAEWYESEKPCLSDYDYDHNQWKYVAKEITFLEEIPLEEIIPVFNPFNEILETIEEYHKIHCNKDLVTLARSKWLKISDKVFSKGFQNYVFEKKMFTSIKSYVGTEQRLAVISAYGCLCKALDAIKDEQISQDVKVMLFLEMLEEKNV